jgi:hypothetical protein
MMYDVWFMMYDIIQRFNIHTNKYTHAHQINIHTYTHTQTHTKLAELLPFLVSILPSAVEIHDLGMYVCMYICMM